jgi:hypothetical protein
MGRVAEERNLCRELAECYQMNGDVWSVVIWVVKTVL